MPFEMWIPVGDILSLHLHIFAWGSTARFILKGIPEPLFCGTSSDTDSHAFVFINCQGGEARGVPFIFMHFRKEVFPKNYVPSVAELEKYKSCWNKLDNYCVHEKALSSLFRGPDSPYTKNTDLSHIIIKASALNDFYSTNIYRIHDVAKRILEIKDFDKRLEQGDEELVEKIRYVDYIFYSQSQKEGEKRQKLKPGQEVELIKGKKKIDSYSFATKYCSHHQPDKFPIYDRYVALVLCELRDKFGVDTKSKTDYLEKLRKSYSYFKSQIDALREHFDLGSYTYKDIDRYLWQLGKRYFSPYIDTVNGYIDYDNI